MFGYRLKWNILKRNILCLAFNRLTSTTNSFCHRSFYRFSCRTEGLSNLLAIDCFINTTNFLATSLAFLKKAFFICVTIGIRYILCFIWKDYRFCLRHCPFGRLVNWVLRLNWGFADMAFFLRSLGFHNTGIGWILWLNGSFADMAFFLSSLSFNDTCIGWSLRLNRRFSYMTFFLRSLSFNHTGIGWGFRLNRRFSHMTFFLSSLSCDYWGRLWTWLNILLGPDSKNL